MALYVIFGIVAFLCILYLISTAGRKNHSGFQHLQGWYYAHRGLHGNGVPENSMLAFERAKQAGYGVELDVHLLKDGSLAVIHDSTLKRTTGREGIVEDLTAQELEVCYLENTYQTIPLFSQVLDLFDGAAPLIIELKCVQDNYAQLCARVCQMLDGYQGVYCLESFDPRCVYWLRKNRPDLIRGQLSENYFKSPGSKLPWFLKLVLSWQMLNICTYPDFVAYRFRDRGHISDLVCRKIWHLHSVSWTLRSQEDFQTACVDGSLPIFEGFIPQ